MRWQNITTIEASKTRRDAVYFDTSDVRKHEEKAILADEGALRDIIPVSDLLLLGLRRGEQQEQKSTSLKRIC